MATQTFLRWRFEDPADPTLAANHTFALNPNQMSSPFPRRNITTKSTTAINGRTLVIEGQRTPTEWTFGGDFLDPNHYEALRAWVLDRTGRRLFLWDHFGRKMTVIPIAFDPTPKRVIARYWRHTYEITCLVLDIEGPTFRVDAPMVPRQFTGTGGYLRATVTWQPPQSARGSAILYYRVRETQKGTEFQASPSGALTQDFTRLNDGNVTFQISAVSTAGEGPTVETVVYVKPIVGPSGYKITSAVMSYDNATIKWTQPTDNGGAELSHWIVTAKQTATNSTKGNATFSVPADKNTFKFTGLASSANTYDFTVVGVNTADKSGQPAVKQAKTLQATAPSAPVITSVVATAFSVRVEWATPVRDGGLPLAYYNVNIESFVGGQNGDANVTNLPLTTHGYTFTGLRPGLIYRVFVYAVSGVLQSAAVKNQSTKTITTLKAN